MMTRNSDYFISWEERGNIPARAKADVFVSIYGNSAGAGHPDTSELEAYDYDSGLGLTHIVDRSILQSLNVRTRGVRRY
ncbi:N-acetylmuramoyl-L-alanine amidase [Nostoc sp. T09]|uniref:N-acetylmuramoyl-L-alanine amidase n=1 Tax=Nostoc sp. T09 TaxID=1932621 RepID=UPI0015C4F43F|nr:N-acetylmuramoyl-L-alanine amidase [Nostoc sp. T09]